MPIIPLNECSYVAFGGDAKLYQKKRLQFGFTGHL